MTSSTAPLPAARRRPVSQTRARINFAVFAAVVIGGGWLFVAMDRATGQLTGTGSATSTGGTTSGQGLWILAPALVALALYFGSRDGAGPLGLTLRFPHRIRWFAFAAGLFPVATAVIVAAATVTGVATFSAEPAAGKPSFLAAFAGVLGFLVVKNVLEEFIFRGYGTRTAAALGLRGIGGHLLVGLVWALWHAPLYLVWMSPADLDLVTSLPLLAYLATFCLGTVVLAVVYGEMRLQTGSIWPGVLLHTVSSALATPLLINGHLRFDGHGDALLTVIPNSVASMLLFGGVGLYLYRRRTGARNGS